MCFIHVINQLTAVQREVDDISSLLVHAMVIHNFRAPLQLNQDSNVTVATHNNSA